jgi:uncharacterized protein involved in outer membrane biogenesis
MQFSRPNLLAWPNRFWQSVWLRRLFWACLCLLALCVLAWAALPSVIQSQLQERGSAALGRKVTVGSVEVKPWSLALTLTDLKIASADGQSDQLAIGRFYAAAHLQSLWHMAPVMDAITIDSPSLHVHHLANGSFDFDDILQRLAERNKGAQEPPGSPLRFALFNLELSNGAIDFDDQIGLREHKHSVRNLHLALPFLSNLDSKRDVTVQPHLAFEINGTKFDTAVQGTPFAPLRKGEMALRIEHLDVAPYLPYLAAHLPASVPVTLESAVLDTSLKLAFEQPDTPRLKISGEVTVSDLQLAKKGGAKLFSVGSVKTLLEDVRPLEQVVKLTSVQVTGLKLHAARDSTGKLNLDMAAPEKVTPPAAVASPWQFELGTFKMENSALAWSDQALGSPAALAINHLDATLTNLRWPLAAIPQEMQFAVAADVTGAAPGAVSKAAHMSLKGAGSPAQGQLDVTLADFALGMFQPYFEQFVRPRVQGVLAAQSSIHWNGSDIKLMVEHAALQKFALTAPRSPASANSTAADPGGMNTQGLPSFDALEVTGADIDLQNRSVAIAKIVLRQPNASVVRGEDAQWMFSQWLKDGPGKASDPAKATALSSTPAKASPWAVALADVSLDGGSVKFVDRVPTRPVLIDVFALKAQAKGVTLDGKKPASVSVSAKVRSGQEDPGTLAFNGSVQMSPMAVQGTMDMRQIPLQVAAPYFLDRFYIELLRADATFRGQLRYSGGAAGPSLQVNGDAALDELRVNSVQAAQKDSADASPTEELLRWKSLSMPGIDLTMTPGEALRLKLREVALADFFARLIVSAQGRLVLQDLVKPQDVGPQLPPSAAQPAPIIDVGPISIINGRVAYTDRFIKPNYSADLSELNGKLSHFSSQSPDGSVQMADLELRGRAEGTAGLEIVGKLNPLARPLALDIRGKVRDLELSPLSSYAIKYAGYGIERGKLSVDVAYNVKPDGQLAATNNIVLSQLTFGEKVEGTASLPVKLAVTLLSDRHGVIDLNLPISGSLNDPTFSIWPVVWKIVGNLITKALTSPFSLFSGGGPEEEDLATVLFTPGTAVMAGNAAESLDKAIKGLIDKPALKTTVVGTASLEVESNAIKLDRLNTLMLGEKRRIVGAAGKDVAGVDHITDAETPALLKEVYRRSDFKKPRNVVGLTKDLPTDEMRTLLLQNMVVNEDTVRELARTRGVVVREYMTAHQLPSERIFLGAEELAPASPTSPTSPAWKPHVELSVFSD